MRWLLVSIVILAGSCSNDSGDAARVRDVGRALDAAREPGGAPARVRTALEEAVGRDISAKAGEEAVVDCAQPALDGGSDCTVRIGGRVMGVSITTWGDTTAPQGWILADGSLRNDRMPLGP